MEGETKHGYEWEGPGVSGEIDLHDMGQVFNDEYTITYHLTKDDLIAMLKALDIEVTYHGDSS